MLMYVGASVYLCVCVCVCVHVCVYALRFRIVSLDKILHFINIWVITTLHEYSTNYMLNTVKI